MLRAEVTESYRDATRRFRPQKRQHGLSVADASHRLGLAEIDHRRKSRRLLSRNRLIPCVPACNALRCNALRTKETQMTRPAGRMKMMRQRRRVRGLGGLRPRV